MHPFMPSFPSVPNQVQAHGINNPNPQQVGLMRPHMANSSNLGSGNLAQQLPCSCPHQIPSQSHAFNIQIPVPMMNTFNNQNAHLSNLHGSGVSLPNRPPSLPFPCFPNGVAGNHVMQNGYVGMVPQNFNQMVPFPVHGQFCNVPQNLNSVVPPRPHGQFFHNGLQNPNQIMQSPQGCFHPQNLSQNMSMQPNGQVFSHNFSQNLNQITGLPNGQLCSQNPIQNLNQVMPMQSSHHPTIQNHDTPFNIHPSSHPPMACSNQTPQVLGSQNSVFPVNSQLGVGNSSMVSSTEGRKFNNQGQMHRPPMNLQPNGFQQPQGSNVYSGGNYISNTNQGNGKGPNMRFQKSKLHHMADEKGNFRPAHWKQGKGNRNKGAGKSALVNSSNKVKYPPLIYTEEEVRQWIEARKKNFPTRAIQERKLDAKLANKELLDNDAKMRRQQLKEIIAKQEEMGVEVAELPPNYLSESENKGGNGYKGRMGKKRGRFGNKFFDKRGKKHGQRYQRAKKQRPGGNASFPASISDKRKPSLLQKLLTAEINRDKSHLLQVFRFMVLNNFFKDYPEKPLEFPLITVNDVGIYNGVFVTEEALHGGDGVVSAVENTAALGPKHQDCNHIVMDEDDCDKGDEDDCDKDDREAEELIYDLADENGGINEDIEESDSEEGEITD